MFVGETTPTKGGVTDQSKILGSARWMFQGKTMVSAYQSSWSSAYQYSSYRPLISHSEWAGKILSFVWGYYVCW